MRAAAYIRVSSEEQAQEGLSLPMQETVCSTAATDAGASSVEVFCDGGYSGTTLRRPALKALLSRLTEFDLLVVWRIDRLARRLRHRLELLDTITDAGLAFHSCTEQLDLDTAMGRAFVQILGVISEVEVGLLRERVKATLDHRARELHLPSGRPPYGYRHAGNREPWAVEPAEAQVVRELYRRYAAGEQLLSLARYLNSAGVPPQRGGRYWQHTVVRRLLANPAYLGQLRHRGEAIPGLHEPLVEEALWREVAARLEANTRVAPKGRYSYSLTPVLRCGICGVTPRMSARHPGGPGVYQCPARLAATEKHVSTSAGVVRVHATIWAAVQALTKDVDFERAMATHLRRNRPAIREWQTRLAAIDGDLSYNLQAARAGAIDFAVLTAQNSPLLEEKKRLLTKLEAEAAKPGQEDGLRALRAQGAKHWIRRLEQEAPVETQVAALKQLWSRVELHPGYLRCVFQHPDLPPLIAPLPPKRDPYAVPPCYFDEP